MSKYKEGRLAAVGLHYRFIAAALTTAILSTNPALADPAKKSGPSDPGKDVPQVPGDDIFGFTSPTDVGNPGDSGFANENDGRVGKRDGRYGALNTKYEFSRTVADNWWMAGSFFGAYNRARDVPDIDNINRINFDGLSFEIVHRVISRSASNPFAVSISVEPRWGRVDGMTGQTSNSYGAAFKLFVDAVVVPDKLFWGANLVWAPQRAQDPADRSQWLNSSSALASAALTYQVSTQLFVGAEVRYLSAFDTTWMKHEVGHAVYLGPTLLWKITDKAALNVTYQPQIAGRSIANPDLNLDLDNFERAQFRAKFVLNF